MQAKGPIVEEKEQENAGPIKELHEKIKNLNHNIFNTTLNNLHILHQYRCLLQLVQSIVPNEDLVLDENPEEKPTAQKKPALTIEIPSPSEASQTNTNTEASASTVDQRIQTQQQEIQKYKHELLQAE